jgi:hypothetical protein
MPFKLHDDFDTHEFLKDSRVSWKARGIIFMLLDMPQRSTTIGTLAPRSGDGITSTQSGLQELESLGYVYRYRNHGENARIVEGEPMSRVAHIYVVKLVDEGIYKIGQTKNLELRLCSLIKKHGPVNLEYANTTTEANEFEGRLHSLFAEKHVEGEWFRLDEADIEHIRGLGA